MNVLSARGFLGLSLAVCFAAMGQADVYTQNFETDTTSSWKVNPSTGANATDTVANFFFDYGMAAGIPKAPNSAIADGTRGLKLQANLSSNVFGGLSVSPLGVNMGQQFTLRFDWWANYNGPLGPTTVGGNGSTNLSTFGVGTNGNVTQWPGATKDSVFFGATGDGGSGNDWRAYSSVPAAGAIYAETSGVYAAGNAAGSTNNTNTFYTTRFPVKAAPAGQVTLFSQQTGTTQAGAAGMAWHDVIIDKTATEVTWTVDGFRIATVPLTGSPAPAFGGGNFFFGHSDINGTSSTDANDASLLFTLIDNVQVASVPEAGSLLFGAVAVATGGVCCWFRRRSNAA